MRRRAALLALAYLSIAIALLAARPAPTPGPLARDFEAYWSAGRTWNAHRDPYGRRIWSAERGVPGVDARRDEVLPFVGPPPVLLGWSLFARLSPAAAARLWLMFLAIVLLALVALTVRGGRTRVTLFSLLAALAVATAFGPVTSDLALGQIALLSLLGAVVAVEGRIAAAALGSFVALLQPNIALGLLSQLGRNRTTVGIAIAALAAYAAGAVAAGWSWPVLYEHVLVMHGAAERFTAIQISPASIAYGFGAPVQTAASISIAVALIALAAGAVVAARVSDRYARFAACAALAPLVAGFFHEHDLVVAYPAALWCAMRTHGGTRVAAFAGTLLVAIDWLGLAQRPTGIIQSALLAVAALCAFAALGSARDLRRTLLAALPIAALFAGAAWLAGKHPAPVWPDALGAFHAPAQAMLPAVWLAEQHVTGLTAAVPAWSLLRLLSLAGCALLAWAIYRRCAYRRTA